MAFCRSKNQNIAATSRERKTCTAFLLNFLKKYVARGITASQVMALSLASKDKRKDIEVQINKLNEAARQATRTEELTLPGFLHDSCSTAHNLIQASPAIRELRLRLSDSDSLSPRCTALLDDLATLEAHLHEYIFLENAILFPRAAALAEQGAAV